MNNDERDDILYKLKRNPERNIITIDVGNLSTKEAEHYIKELMSKFRSIGDNED